MALAAAVSRSPQYVSQLLKGGRPVPAELCIVIERATRSRALRGPPPRCRVVRPARHALRSRERPCVTRPALAHVRAGPASDSRSGASRALQSRFARTSWCSFAAVANLAEHARTPPFSSTLSQMACCRSSAAFHGQWLRRAARRCAEMNASVAMSLPLISQIFCVACCRFSMSALFGGGCRGASIVSRGGLAPMPAGGAHA